MTKELTLVNVVTDLESFGGKSLIENAKEVEQALARTEPLQGIFNHSHSQWTWRHLVLSYLSSSRNLRQIIAELAKKRDALWEAKWRCIERNQDIKELTAQLEDEVKQVTTGEFERTRLEIALQKKREEQEMSIKRIEGAMKDVLTLTKFYDDLCEKYNIKTEEDFEKQESFSHLCRALTQAIRDIRQSGRISTGNQEYLEQIGINPSKVFSKLLSHIEREMASEEWGTETLHVFVTDLATKLVPYTEKRMDRMGYTTELIHEALSNGEIK